MDSYFQRPEVSNSDLSRLKNVLAGKSIEKHEADLAEQFKFGNLVDAMLTEPNKVNYYSLRVGDVEYTQAEFAKAILMRDNFFKHPLCKGLHDKSTFQKECVKTLDIEHADNKFQLPARCRYDMHSEHLGMAGEIKTTVATTLKAFESSINFMDYDRARAWYMDISGMDMELLIGLSKVNFKVFIVPVKRGDNLYLKGKEKYSAIAYEYYKIMKQL